MKNGAKLSTSAPSWFTSCVAIGTKMIMQTNVLNRINYNFDQIRTQVKKHIPRIYIFSSQKNLIQFYIDSIEM